MVRLLFLLLALSDLVLLIEFVLIACLIRKPYLSRRFQHYQYRLRWSVFPAVRARWRIVRSRLHLVSSCGASCWFELHAAEVHESLAAEVTVLWLALQAVELCRSAALLVFCARKGKEHHKLWPPRWEMDAPLPGEPRGGYALWEAAPRSVA